MYSAGMSHPGYLSYLSLFALVATACSDDVAPAGGGGAGGQGACLEEPPAIGCPESWDCVDGTWVQNDLGCGDDVCPQQPPGAGDACAVVGYVCAYGTDANICGDGTTPVFALCEAGGWGITCGAEPPCPLDLPSANQACGAEPRSCTYDNDCGIFVIPKSATCDPEASPNWVVPEVECPSCQLYADPASCAADAACIWLEPGCDAQLEPISVGCRPNVDCSLTGCPAEDLICVQFSTDPCWDAACEECHAPFGVCVGPEGI